MPQKCAEGGERQLYGLPRILYIALIRVSATIVGQYFLYVVDRILWTLETLTYWSIPPNRLAKVTNKPQSSLERPLPWWFFLVALIYLRIFRKCVSVGLWFVGIKPVTPISMVHFIQYQRKKVLAIKQMGAKIIIQRREESSKKTGILQAVWNKVQQVFCLQYIYYDDEDIKVIRSKKYSEEVTSDETDEENVEEETRITLTELLEKFANIEDDPNDSDYVPPEEESSTEDSSEDEDDDEDEVQFGGHDPILTTRKKPQSSYFASSPHDQMYSGNKTPPMRVSATNTLHPGHNTTIPLKASKISAPGSLEPENQEVKALNGNSVDRRKGSNQKRNHHKYRGDFKHNNNVRKLPVIKVLGTNNNGEFAVKDAPQYSTAPGSSSFSEHTHNKEVKTSEKHQEIF
ncbi:hypothetical protein DMENIID0001_099930 [Sergentomyia squamirostris]